LTAQAQLQHFWFACQLQQRDNLIQATV